MSANTIQTTRRSGLVGFENTAFGFKTAQARLGRFYLAQVEKEMCAAIFYPLIFDEKKIGLSHGRSIAMAILLLLRKSLHNYPHFCLTTELVLPILRRLAKRKMKLKQ